MKYALFSDIHSNHEAFERVLEDIDQFKPDKKVFLGDIIGYGPYPAESIKLLRETADIIIGGNHDFAAIGKTAYDYFNPFAKEAIDWTIRQLSEEDKKFINTLVSEMVVDDTFQIAHSSPLYPDEWNYILSYHEALSNYSHIKKNLCFVGHSHQPLVIRFKNDAELEVSRPDKAKLEIEKFRYIVNIGSVGQPRDYISSACWVLYDSDSHEVTFRRVVYDIKKVQNAIKEFSLPLYLADRLEYGR